MPIDHKRIVMVEGLAIGFAPAAILWVGVIYFGIVFLTGSFNPPTIAGAPLPNSATIIEKLDVVKPIINWLVLLMGLGLSGTYTIMPWVGRPCTYLVAKFWPEFKTSVEKCKLEDEEKERIEGPQDIRFLRRRIARYERHSNSFGLTFDWFLSFRWILGESKTGYLNHLKQQVSDWESEK